MASTLNTNIAMAGDHWLVTGSLADGGTLPKEIFIYENTGDGTLGTFSGTCNLQELGRLQIITLGTPQPVFGNKYLRHSQIKIDVALQDSPSSVVLALVANVKALSVAYANQVSTSTSYPIP